MPSKIIYKNEFYLKIYLQSRTDSQEQQSLTLKQRLQVGLHNNTADNDIQAYGNTIIINKLWVPCPTGRVKIAMEMKAKNVKRG